MASSKSENRGRGIDARSSQTQVFDAVDLQPELDREGSLCEFNPQFGAGSLRFAELAACDLMGVGLLVCDRDCRIAGANRVALAILRAGDSLKVDVHGVLRANRNHDLSIDALLRKMIARALDGESAAAFVVPRAANAAGLTIIVKRSVGRAGHQQEQSPLVHVLMIDPAQPVTDRCAGLQRLYGLSIAEAQLANLLLDGLSLVHCCDELAISPTEGRTRLQALLRKTGVRRRIDLLTLLKRELAVTQPRAGNNEFVESRITAERTH